MLTALYEVRFGQKKVLSLPSTYINSDDDEIRLMGLFLYTYKLLFSVVEKRIVQESRVGTECCCTGIQRGHVRACVVQASSFLARH